MPESSRFLSRVWGAQRAHNAYAYLAWKDDDGSWHDQPHTIEGGKLLGGLRLPNGGRNVYFAPCLFRDPRRFKSNALAGRWLYADLDEVDPRSLSYLPPTAAWETSRGRFQAAWLLDRLLKPSRLADLNQRLTYFTGADRGGWSLTKVLRLPGSVSTKHGYEHRVRRLWFERSRSYSFAEVHSLVKDVVVPASASSVGDLRLPREKPSEIAKRYELPTRARKLLRTRTAVQGERSERLWELENLLLDAGMAPEEVVMVVRPTAWNKYRGQRRELAQLWSEVSKAAAQRNHREPQVERGPRELVSFDAFVAQRLPKPRWLVESIWSDTAHGILAGEPKTYKSVISTDLAVSVASGSRFLNHFPVPKKGPVILIQEENEPGEVQDRLRRIAHAKALTGKVHVAGDTLELEPSRSLPIQLLNNEGFDLTEDDDMEWLEAQVKALRPVLVVLDPLYLMMPGVDENSAREVTPVLRRLLSLKQSYGVGILIIHHYHKQNAQSPRQGMARMSGTGVFGRWFESALYVEATPDPYTVRLVPDHRGHAPQGVVHATFDLGAEDDLTYDVDIMRPREDRVGLHAKLDALMERDPEPEFAELRQRMGSVGSGALKTMLKDHGYVVVNVSTGKAGRPKLAVRRAR